MRRSSHPGHFVWKSVLWQTVQDNRNTDKGKKKNDVVDQLWYEFQNHMSPHTCRQVITFTKLSTLPTISLEQLRGENDLDPKVKK